MKTLFLAGGQGTRLKPLTNDLPKPMVPIMGKPLLERTILKLKNSDVNLTEVIFSACYKPHKIKDYFGNGNRYGIKIIYVLEETPLGTGGAIKNTEEFYDDAFLILNADILSDIDYKDMFEFHKSKNADVTIAATSVENPSMYGIIEYTADDYAISFIEKPKPDQITSNYINAGAYIFEPHVLKEISAGKEVSVEREVFPNLLKKGYKVAVYKYASYWLDIGTPEKYLQAHKDILSGKYSLTEFDFSKQKIFKKTNIKIHKTAKIQGPVYFGDNIEIGANSHIGPNVVLGDNSIVGEKCKITESVIWDNVVVGKGASISDTIVISNCQIDANYKCSNYIYADNSSLKLAM